MRKEQLPRLAGVHLKTKAPDYIHLYFLQADIHEALTQHARGQLLDLGCGNKPYEEWYAPLSSSTIGCDVIQSSLNRVDVLCEATNLPFEPGSFDTVFCTQVMEHVYDHGQLLSEAHRVLRPGGHLVLTVPFCWELHEEPYDFFRFSKHGLQNLFEAAGFTDIAIKANGGKWAAAFQMLLNTVYSSFKNKNWRTKLLKILFIELRFTWLINKIAIRADKRHRDDVWTLNYLIVAKK
jgi:SAM-dependent methyltransferase